jgi:phosphatidylglycerophosphate synthase
MQASFAAMGRAALRGAVASGLTANQVTWLGLVLVLANCAFYLVHQSAYWLGVGVSLSYAFDALDGALARQTGTASKFGGYLDAVVDRYEEIVTCLVIGWVNGWWPTLFVVVTGSLLISYNKARAAIETPIDNKAWPDLLDRPRRMFILGGGLILDGAIPVPGVLGGRLLYLALLCLGILAHFTAVQRFLRARRLLTAAALGD